MPKFFIVSDIHGFYDEFKAALDEAGFDPGNPEHWLVGCGDYTDRGRQPWQVMHYLMKLPQKVLVRGNHEELLTECVNRGFPYMHDNSNGTTRTILDLAPRGWSFDESCDIARGKIQLFTRDMVDYFETKNYIFVHSWIPLKNCDGLPKHYTKERRFEFNPNWRNATAEEWSEARWGNPFELAAQGLMPDKTIVFGHWHCSAGWTELDPEEYCEFGSDARFDPYYGNGFIAIDACTAHSKKVNVIVIEDDFKEGDGKNE